MNRYRFKAAWPVWGGAVHQPPAQFGSKHQVVMMSTAHGHHVRTSMGAPAAPQMIRPPCQVQGFFRAQRKAPIRP
jgi:hypothetical protein